MQVELKDSNGKKWYMDPAERFNVPLANFEGWRCNVRFSGLIIREPDGSVKGSYLCPDAPLGNIETSLQNHLRPIKTCITKSCVSSQIVRSPKLSDKYFVWNTLKLKAV